MSLGYRGRIQLAAKDRDIVLYRYCGENWNDHTEARGKIEVLDGEIAINIAKLKAPVSLSEALKNGAVEIIKTCVAESTETMYSDFTKLYFAGKLLYMVFKEFEKSGEWLKEEWFFV